MNESAIEAAPIKKPRQPNPVYDHLTRRRKWPSVRVAAKLCIALNLLGAIVLAAIWQPDAVVGNASTIHTAFPSVVTIELSLVMAIISPFISAAVAAVGTARFANDEALALLMLGKFTPATVVRGHFEAAVFRLRLLWVACFGLLLPLWVATTILASVIAVVFAGGGVGDVDLRLMLIVSVPLAGVIGFAALVGVILNWLAICIGIWVGLRWHKPSTALTISQVGVLISIVVLLLIVGGWTYINVRLLINVDTFLPLRVLIVLLAFVYPFGGVALLNSARSRLWQ